MYTIKLFFLFFLYANTISAQTKRVDNLVFEGAGIRGLAYCGAIKILEENRSLTNVKRIAGTSAGAITALLLSLNYTAKEIEEIIGSTNYRKFNDGGFPFFGGIRRFNKKYGWYKGNKIEHWLQNLIAQKTGNANITFEELNKSYKSLYITGTSINAQKAFMFSAETFPTMKVKDAVRISMSIPFYYQAVCMDSVGNVYEKPYKKNNYHLMVDGGLMNNFPIDTFDSTKYMDQINDNSYFINPYTIGFRVDNTTQIALDNNPYNTLLAPKPVKKIGDYLNAFFVLNLELLNRQKLKPEDWLRSVSISDAGIGPKVRKMHPKEIDTLVQNGQHATTLYFTK
jgi:NTE family protein